MATGQKPPRVDAHLASTGVLKDLRDAAEELKGVCEKLITTIENEVQNNSKLKNTQSDSLQVTPRKNGPG